MYTKTPNINGCNSHNGKSVSMDKPLLVWAKIDRKCTSISCVYVLMNKLNSLTLRM